MIPSEMMNFSDGTSSDCEQVFFSRSDGSCAIPRSPLPVAPYPGIVHPCHYWGYTTQHEQAYSVQTPNFGVKLQPQNFENERSEEEVSSSNIFADTYAKAVGLYKLPKAEVGEESLSESSERDSIGEQDSDIDEAGSRKWVQGTDKIGALPEYFTAEGELSSCSTLSNHLEISLMMSNNTGETMVRPHAEFVDADEEDSEEESGWNDSECDAQELACTDVKCPGDITPYFQKFLLPKHKMPPRGPSSNEHVHHNPFNAAEGGRTHEERKLLLRRLKNREAAKRCRKKKKEEFKSLLLEQETLLDEVHHFYHEIHDLKEKLSCHNTPTGNSYINF